VRENDEVVDGDGAREDTGACLVGCRDDGEAHGAERGARGVVVQRGDRCSARVRGRAHDVLGMALGTTRAIVVVCISDQGEVRLIQ
jgi:hypothetical protein